MKRKLMTLFAVLAMSVPVAAVAQQRGGGHGYSGGHGGGGYSGRAFSGGDRGGYSYRGGDSYRGGYSYRGGDGDRRGWGDRGGYYRGGFGFGYSYAPNPCNRAGYYDQWGRWVPYAGCYVPPYGY